jgi:hypothetical protein
MNRILEGLNLEIDYHTDMMAWYAMQEAGTSKETERKYFKEAIDAHNKIRNDKTALVSSITERLDRDNDRL